MVKSLPVEVTVDNGDAPADRDYDRDRTIRLLFLKMKGGYDVYAYGAPFLMNRGGLPRGRVRITRRSLTSSIADLKDAWHETLLYSTRSPRRRSMFVERFDGGLDLPQAESDLVWLKLARAGHQLYARIFETNGDAGMRVIASNLSAALSSAEHMITVESNLPVPWNLLYTTQRGENIWEERARCRMEGFWAYKHIVEQTPGWSATFDSRVLVNDGVVVGMNVDGSVDNEPPASPYVASMIRFFEAHAKILDVRRTKADVARALQDPRLADHIIFFGCHGGEGSADNSGPYLLLERGEKVYGSDFPVWLRRGRLPSGPIVFVGACRGGQLSTMFFPSFGTFLLGSGARCLLGPQVDIPKDFAREYAGRLFGELFNSGTPLGDTVRSLAREFADRHNSPFGLVFSLYRGADVHLWTGGPQ